MGGITAGSALIQACEKAGVTIPRFVLVVFPILRQRLTSCVDTAIMSSFLSNTPTVLMLTHSIRKLMIAGNCKVTR